jgi:hypothetical protein
MGLPEQFIDYRDPYDKVVLAILAFGYSYTFIKIKCPVSQKRSSLCFVCDA